MPKPRSVSAHAPSLDRTVLRAIADRRGTWARSAAALEKVASEHYGRSPLHWVAHPEESLFAALSRHLGGDAAIALPAWGRPSLGPAARRNFTTILWMDPDDNKLDPGPTAIKEALSRGARAVVLAPVAGDCSALEAATALCEDADALLAVDGRASAGSRSPKGGPEAYGSLSLLPVDGDPMTGACTGALLATSLEVPNGTTLAAPSPLQALGSAFATLAASVRDEPRLRRIWSGPRAIPTEQTATPTLSPPGWAFAAAHARLLDANQRASQRGRHARSLREHCGNLPAISLAAETRGCPAAGAAFPLLAQSAGEVTRLLHDEGLSTLQGLGGWLAPESEHSDRARHIADRVILLPLHPFYRDDDLRLIGELLRRATLRTHGTGQADPTVLDA